MNRSLMELICSQSPDLIFHATNGFKFDSEVIEKGAQHLISIRDNVFENWHQGWLSMAAFSGMSYILTVDSCTHWFWDGNEETVNKTKSASTSGVLNPLGEWEVQAPDMVDIISIMIWIWKQRIIISNFYMKEQVVNFYL